MPLPGSPGVPGDFDDTSIRRANAALKAGGYKGAGDEIRFLSEQLRIVAKNFGDTATDATRASDKAKILIETFKGINKEAFNAAAGTAELSDAVKEYNEASVRTFGGTIPGIARMGRDLESLTALYKELEVANAASAAQGTMSSRQQENIFGLAEERARLKETIKGGSSTPESNLRLASVEYELKLRGLATTDKSAKAELQLFEAKKKSGRALSDALAPLGSFGSLGAKAASAADRMSLGFSAMSGAGKDSGIGIKVVNTAAELGITALGGLASSLAPLLSGVSASMVGFTVAGKLLMSFIKGVELAKMTGGKAMQALAMGSADSFGDMGMAIGDTQRKMESMAGVSTPYGQLIASTFRDDVTPAVFSSLKSFVTFDRTSREATSSWAGTLGQVAIQGSRMGLDYAKSISIASTQARAFGLGHEGVNKAFENVIRSARTAALDVDTYTEAVGSAMDIGTNWGDQNEKMFGASGSLSTLGARMGGLNEGQKKLVIGGVTALANDPARMLGYAQASGLSSRAAMEGLLGAGGEKGGIAGHSLDLLKSIIGGKKGGFSKGGKSLVEQLSDKDSLVRGEAQMALSTVFKGNIGSMGAFGNKEVKDLLGKISRGEQLDEKEKKKLDSSMLEGGNVMEKGAQAMVSQQDTLQTLVNLIDSIAQTVGMIAGSWLFRGTGETADQRLLVARMKAGAKAQSLHGLDSNPDMRPKDTGR